MYTEILTEFERVLLKKIIYSDLEESIKLELDRVAPKYQIAGNEVIQQIASVIVSIVHGETDKANEQILIMGTEEREKTVKLITDLIPNKSSLVINNKTFAQVMTQGIKLIEVSEEEGGQSAQEAAEKAQIAFSRAIALNPYIAEVYFFRAKAYAAIGFWKTLGLGASNSHKGRAIKVNYYNQSIADMTKAIELQPQNASFYLFRARYRKDVIEETENDEEANRLCTEGLIDCDFALSLGAENDDLQAAILETRAELTELAGGDEEDVITEYNRILALQPNNAQVLVQRAFVYVDLGNMEAAKRDAMTLLNFAKNASTENECSYFSGMCEMVIHYIKK